jgi:hypothetical protein
LKFSARTDLAARVSHTDLADRTDLVNHIDLVAGRNLAALRTVAAAARIRILAAARSLAAYPVACLVACLVTCLVACIVRPVGHLAMAGSRHIRIRAHHILRGPADRQVVAVACSLHIRCEPEAAVAYPEAAAGIE